MIYALTSNHASSTTKLHLLLKANMNKNITLSKFKNLVANKYKLIGCARSRS